MEIYSGVVVNGVEYEDDEIANVPTDIPLVFGRDWFWLGDCDGDIYVKMDDGTPNKSFDGETGLNDFLAWYHSR